MEASYRINHMNFSTEKTTTTGKLIKLQLWQHLIKATFKICSNAKIYDEDRKCAVLISTLNREEYQIVKSVCNKPLLEFTIQELHNVMLKNYFNCHTFVEDSDQNEYSCQDENLFAAVPFTLQECGEIECEGEETKGSWASQGQSENSTPASSTLTTHGDEHSETWSRTSSPPLQPHALASGQQPDNLHSAAEPHTQECIEAGQQNITSLREYDSNPPFKSNNVVHQSTELNTREVHLNSNNNINKNRVLFINKFNFKKPVKISDLQDNDVHSETNFTSLCDNCRNNLITKSDSTVQYSEISHNNNKSSVNFIPPIVQSVNINHKNVQIHINSGASFTIVGSMTFARDFPEISIEKCNTSEFCEINGMVLRVVGIAYVKVYQRYRLMTLQLLIVDGFLPIIAGKDWIKRLNLQLHHSTDYSPLRELQTSKLRRRRRYNRRRKVVCEDTKELSVCVTDSTLDIPSSTDDSECELQEIVIYKGEDAYVRRSDTHNASNSEFINTYNFSPNYDKNCSSYPISFSDNQQTTTAGPSSTEVSVVTSRPSTGCRLTPQENELSCDELQEVVVITEDTRTGRSMPVTMGSTPSIYSYNRNYTSTTQWESPEFKTFTHHVKPHQITSWSLVDGFYYGQLLNSLSAHVCV
jgi:hypothetical protein